MQNYKKKFVEFIFRVGALQFGDFTLKNGKKSPYFFNSSKFNTGSLIEELGLYYALTIEENFPKCNLIFEKTKYLLNLSKIKIVLAI